MTTTQRLWKALSQSPQPLTVGQLCHAVGLSEGNCADTLKRFKGRSFQYGPVIVGPSGRGAQTWAAIPDGYPQADERGRGRPREDDETVESVEARLRAVEAQKRRQKWSAA